MAGEHFTVILALVLIAVGYYYLKTRDVQPEGPALERKHFIQSVKHDQDPWVLRSMSYSHVVGETRLDLSLAIFEEKEVTLVLRGLVGDIDVIIPDDVGVCVEGSILFGQLDVGADKGAGVMNRLDWHSLITPVRRTG
ncbi:cell wall-active antibiotics response protein LiaF [Paenibacillus sp. CC-CFT747]|nr:cell wall-active antibiotics response protein LiaF [Paenibacillus sp. CC-CFT747]